MAGNRFPADRSQRFLEDYTAGLVLEFGAVPVDEAEVVEFARRFDPQPFHIDPAQAASGPFGGLIASGWHTGSLMMRMLVEHYLSPSSLGSPDSTNCAGCGRCGLATPCRCESPSSRRAARSRSPTAAWSGR
jgi:acyl dehydratase